MKARYLAYAGAAAAGLYLLHACRTAREVQKLSEVNGVPVILRTRLLDCEIALKPESFPEYVAGTIYVDFFQGEGIRALRRAVHRISMP